VETDLTEKEGAAPTTLRARLEAHRANPTCAGCHMLFEPMGIAMENFDAVGRWRQKDNGIPVDPTGVTNDEIPLNGIESLREFTVLKQDLFAQVVTEKLLTYAMGRGIEIEDMPLLRAVAEKAAEDDYKFSSLVMGVVQSPAFTMNQKSAESEDVANVDY
jgi:hypothetical protein